MTRHEAHVILNNLLDQSLTTGVEGRYNMFKDSPYPGLAEMYEKYVFTLGISRDFYEEATNHIIIKSSKLGRALK